MKRVFAILIGLSIILPIVVFARVASNCDDYCRNLNEPEIQPPPNQVCICNPLKAPDFETLINNIITFLFYIAVALVPLMIVVGAFYILTAGGEERKITIGKNIITYSLIAFAIILFAKALVAALKEVLGVKIGG
jgi:heme A synthase